VERRCQWQFLSLKKLRPHGEGMNRILSLLRRSPSTRLGPLEQELLSALWMRGSATVREMLDAGGINLAYTTVMTTLDRLYKKQLLNRSAEGRAFRYFPRYTQEELEKAAVGEAVRQMLGSGEAAALPLSYLVEAVSEHDAGLLDDLQRLLDEKRRELRSELQNREKR
jgi:predicted transcriptional regulator